MARSLFENRIFAPRFVAGWVFFTAAAGFVNAAALLAGNNVVSHVTGSVTAFATQPGIAWRIAFIVASFVLGGMLAIFAQQKVSARSAYVLPPLGAAFVLLAIGTLGHAGAFGDFGGDNDVKSEAFPMLALLAFAMGMLNAAVGAATSNRIRVTHLTGPLTDLAGHLVRGEYGWAALRISKLFAFIGGAALAQSLRRFEFQIFGIGAVLVAVAVTLTAAPISLASVRSTRPQHREV